MTALKIRPNALLLCAAVLVCLVLVRDPVWIDSGVIIGIQALIALSVGLCYGQAGMLSLAQAPFAAIGAYASGLAAVKWGWSPVVALPLAIALPALLGWLLARLVIRMEPLSVALATIALATIVEIILRSWDTVTGGYVGLSGIPPAFDTQIPLMYLAMTWAVVCIAVLLYENLMRSKVGRALITVRHDRARALADGVPVVGLMSGTFAISAAFAGAAGWLYAHYVTYLGPSDLGTHLSISVVLMAVVGGAGFVLGPVVGAVLLGVLLRLLPAQENQGLFFGAVLILILLVARDGLLGIVAPRLQKWRERHKKSADEHQRTAKAGATP